VLVAAKGIKNKLKIIIAVSLVAVIFLFLLLPLFPEGIRERLSVHAVVEDRGSGRFDIWTAIWKAIFESDRSIIFGHGIGSTEKILTEQGFLNTVAHNHWLQLWCDQGIIGVILFALLIIVGFFRERKQMLVISIALIGIVALSMSLTLYANYKVFWNILIMSAMNYENEAKQIEGGEVPGESQCNRTGL